MNKEILNAINLKDAELSRNLVRLQDRVDKLEQEIALLKEKVKRRRK